MDATPYPPEPATFSHAQIRHVVLGVVLCIFLAAIDQTVVIPAVPAIAADLNGFSHLSWIVSAYLLTSTAATPIYGKLSDIHGRRAMLLPALVIFTVASALCALATTLPLLIAARALQGLGGAGLMSMAQSAIADVVSPRERGRYQAYLAGTWAVASIAGPIIGGWLTDSLSWRWIFWANLPLGVAAMLLAGRALRVLPRPTRTRLPIDAVGALLLAAAITVALVLMGTAGADASAVEVASLAVASVALLAALIWRERRAADPVLPPRLFAQGTFTRGVAVAFLTAGGIFGATFLLPIYFQLMRGVDAATSGTLIVPFLACNVVGAFSAGQTVRWMGRPKPVLLTTLSLSAAGFLLLAREAESGSHVGLLLGMMLIGVGLGGSMPTGLIIVQNAAEHRDVGAATGALLFLRAMGGAFGASLTGALLATRFAAGLRAAGLPPLDLGSLRGAAAGLSDAARVAARAALSSGFEVSFLVCAGLLALAVLVCVGLRDVTLRSTVTAAARTDGVEPIH